MSYYDFLELLDGGDRAQSKKEEAKQKKKKQIDFAIAKAFFDVIVQEHSLKNMKVEYGAKEFYLVIPTKDGGVEVCLESAKAEKWRQTLPEFLDMAIGGATEKELREYMAEKKLSDASKYRLKISKYGELKDLRSTATYLVIPDNVVEICERAFSFDDSLLSVVIPSSVTTVGERAFQNCKNLKSVVICDGVKIIEEGAFFACSSLASVTIPSSVERIFKLTFMNSGIKSVVIPENVWEIHREAFYYCFSLTEITFRGTKSQWEKVSKGEKWNYCAPAKVVHCSDGDAELTGAAE
ncbi:MAG: leucine-rich repeat domain-containing protein [Treponema sp.]|nr:leucine-rich repeat domain-containing protein [Treponema sp.]